MDVAANNMLQNLKALEQENPDFILSACPTCTLVLKKKGLLALRNQKVSPELIAKAEKMAEKVIDASYFIHKLIKEGRITFSKPLEEEFTYHDPCHLKRSLNIWQEPRESLQKAGLKLKEMFESDICCGMGGSYSLKFPEISVKILERKLKNIQDTGANLVCTDCPGCIMQIRGGADKKGLAFKVKHSLEVLAERL